MEGQKVIMKKKRKQVEEMIKGIRNEVLEARKAFERGLWNEAYKYISKLCVE